MTEPARNLISLDDHRRTNLSTDAVDALVARVTLVNEENDALRDALRREKKAHTLTRKELNDLLERAADGDEIRTFVEWWRDYTGAHARTETGPTTMRAKSYRKLRRKWSSREIAVMIVGACDDPWRKQKGLVDLPDIEKKPDYWYQKGLEVRGGRK